MTKCDADPEDRDPGTALRASMGACVSDIRMPASLLDRAVSRDRKRKARIRLTGAAGAVGVTAAVAAAAVVIATLPGSPSGRPALTRPASGLHALDAAYVLNQAAAVMVDSDRMISVDQSSTEIAYTDVAAQKQRVVNTPRTADYLQVLTVISGKNYTETDVDYRHHVWSTFTISKIDPGGGTAEISSFLPLQTNEDPAIAFREALKAGIITVVGHRTLNGRDTILLRVNSSYRGLRTNQPPASSIWIDASTYLVVQTERFIFHPPLSCKPSALVCHVTWFPVIDHVSWLPPTRQNLALLTVTPPAGFTKIPYSEMAQKYLGPIS
jgi:hypothetical protein